ncbi:MAG: acetyl-CoA carboxylase biotin carboxyl carrier protein subunit [Lentimicrobiaceae bacterium]|jgi:biotin carboxyl carrier protein
MSTRNNSKSLNLKGMPSTDEAIVNPEVEVFQTLIIEDVKYKTRLTKKFLKRKFYEPIDPKKVLSFIPGTIKKVYTAKGKKVKTGDKLVDLEAMKMLNTIFAHDNATVAEVYIKEGDMVPKNQLLILYK